MHPVEAAINEAVAAPRMPRNFLRDMKANARFQQYRGGHAAVMPGFEHQLTRVAAAIEKRERKAQKRLDDAYQMELGQRAAAERLNGHLV